MTSTVNSVSPSLLGETNVKRTELDPASPEGIQNRFLTLLMTQLKNQDPTNPLKNEEITSQMAQLSTVTGISQLNNSVNSLVTNLLNSMQSSQGMQAANLIGKNVVVPGEVIALTSSKGEFGVYLDTPADDVQVTVLNDSGQLVNTIDLGDLPIGVSKLCWDGKTTSGETAPDGKYTFTLTAKNGDTSVEAVALSVGMVGSVSSGSQGVQLDIPGIGPVSFSKVLQIIGVA